MKLILLISLISVASALDLRKFTTMTENGQTTCRRTVSETFVPNAQNPSSITINSIRQCTRDSAEKSTRLLFNINTVRPDITLGYFSDMNTPQAFTQSGGYLRVYFERVIEYVEKNGVPGYQPTLGDVPGVIDFLTTNKWNPIVFTTTSVGTATVHSFQATTVNGEVSFGIHFTTDYLVGTNHTVLVPSATKFDLEILNHNYTDPNATGLAFRVFVVARAGLREKLKNETDTGLDLTDQNGVNVLGDFAWFVWNQFVTSDKGNIDVFSTTLSEDVDRTEAAALLAEDARLHVSTIWLSVPNRPSSLVWDPYVGYDDTYSSGDRVVMTFVLLLACLLAM